MHERWQASGQPIERFLETIPVFEAQSRDKTPAAAMTAAGKVGLDCRYLNFAPQCVGWHDLTRNGGSGSFLIKWSGVWKITTAAAIPYFTGQYGRTPRGFGYVTIGANIEDYQLPAQVMGKQLETRVQDLEGQIERQQGDIRDEIEQRVGRMGFELGFSTLIMIVLVVAIAVWLANLITRRIDETIDGLQRVEERQGFVEGRIQEVEGNLSNAQIIDPKLLDADGRCVFGATVEIEDQDSGDVATYQIVGEDEADIKNAKLSVASPMARALIGKYAGDIAQVQAPGGIREYEIIDVRYE